MSNVNPIYLIESDVMSCLAIRAIKFGSRKAYLNRKNIFSYAKDKYKQHKDKKAAQKK